MVSDNWTTTRRPCRGGAHSMKWRMENPGRVCPICKDSGYREVVEVRHGPYMMSVGPMDDAIVTDLNYRIDGFVSCANWFTA